MTILAPSLDTARNMNIISKTLTVTDAKRRFLEVVEGVSRAHDVVSLTRNGMPAAVILNQDDYEAMLETMEILANPAIMAALRKSRAQARQGRLYSDDEVWD